LRQRDRFTIPSPTHLKILKAHDSVPRVSFSSPSTFSCSWFFFFSSSSSILGQQHMQDTLQLFDKECKKAKKNQVMQTFPNPKRKKVIYL
jgi:hypothetical protein